VTLTASGGTFTSWTVNSGGAVLSPNNTSSVVTFIMPNADVNITGNFAPSGSGSGFSPSATPVSSGPAPTPEPVPAPEPTDVPSAPGGDLTDLIDGLNEDLDDLLDADTLNLVDIIDILKTVSEAIEVAPKTTAAERLEVFRAIVRYNRMVDAALEAIAAATASTGGGSASLNRLVAANDEVALFLSDASESNLILMKESVSTALNNIKMIEEATQRAIHDKVFVDVGDAKTLKIDPDAMALLVERDADVVIVSNDGTFSFSASSFDRDAEDELMVNFDITMDGDNKAGTVKFELMNADTRVIELDKNFEIKVKIASDNIFKLVPYQFVTDGDLAPLTLTKVDGDMQILSMKSNKLGRIILTEELVNLSDLNTISWAKNQIEFLASRRIVTGMPNGTYAGDKLITRAEFLTLLINTFDLNVPGATSNFTDVSASDWYYRSVSVASTLKIVSGYPNGEFKPNAPITRGDMSIIIEKVLRMTDASLIIPMEGLEVEIASEYMDKGDMPQYNVKSVGIVSELEIMNGYPDVNFKATKNANRAEAAVIIHNILNNL
jgi:hypothetical protein